MKELEEAIKALTKEPPKTMFVGKVQEGIGYHRALKDVLKLVEAFKKDVVYIKRKQLEKFWQIWQDPCFSMDVVEKALEELLGDAP